MADFDTPLVAKTGIWDAFKPFLDHDWGPVAQYAEGPRPTEGLVYLGLNGASRETEMKAFEGRQDTTVITGAGADAAMQGKTPSSDGQAVLDLDNTADFERFMREAGLADRRKGKDGELESKDDVRDRLRFIEELFLGKTDEKGTRQGGISPGARDEMAALVKHLQQVETGHAGMDRFIMSGHSSGSWVYSEEQGNPGVSFDRMRLLMSQFPAAQAGVSDMMLSACHTLEPEFDTDKGAQYQQVFPNLESVWGYDGKSPSFRQGSAQHIRNWLSASQGEDAEKVVQMARKTGQNASAKAF